MIRHNLKPIIVVLNNDGCESLAPFSLRFADTLSTDVIERCNSARLVAAHLQILTNS